MSFDDGDDGIPETGPDKFHIRLSGKHTDGVSRCGAPAKQDHVVPWGDDRINCKTCVRGYAADAWMTNQAAGRKVS